MLPVGGVYVPATRVTCFLVGDDLCGAEEVEEEVVTAVGVGLPPLVLAVLLVFSVA